MVYAVFVWHEKLLCIAHSIFFGSYHSKSIFDDMKFSIHDCKHEFRHQFHFGTEVQLSRVQDDSDRT